MNHADIIVETIPVGPLQCNCTILGDLVSRRAIVVDLEAEEVQKEYQTFDIDPPTYPREINLHGVKPILLRLPLSFFRKQENDPGAHGCE